jgi:hypothetical protein
MEGMQFVTYRSDAQGELRVKVRWRTPEVREEAKDYSLELSGK